MNKIDVNIRNTWTNDSHWGTQRQAACQHLNI